MPYSETAPQLWAAAARHLADAYLLLGLPVHRRCQCGRCKQHRVGAMYLGGYAVECALKAYAIRKHAKTRWQEVVDLAGRTLKLRLQGGAGHSLRDLLTAAGLDPTVDPQVKSRFNLCVTEWVPPDKLRYRATGASLSDAKALVAAASDVYDWVRKQP